MDTKRIAEASKIPLIFATALLVVKLIIYSGGLYSLSHVSNVIDLAIVLTPLWAGYNGIRKFKLKKDEAKVVGFTVGLGVSLIFVVLSPQFLFIMFELLGGSKAGVGVVAPSAILFVEDIAWGIIYFTIIGIIGGAAGGEIADKQERNLRGDGRWALILIYGVSIAALSFVINFAGLLFGVSIFLSLPELIILITLFGFVALILLSTNRKENLPILLGILVVLVGVSLTNLLAIYLTSGGGPRTSHCTFPAGFMCIAHTLYANTSKLYLKVAQETGHEIRINGISCTKNISEDYSKTSMISYGGGNGIEMQSGTAAVLSTPTDASKPWLNISCTDANGNLPSSTQVGDTYSGRIYINYTEMDTNITRIVIGTYTTMYEA